MKLKPQEDVNYWRVASQSFKIVNHMILIPILMFLYSVNLLRLVKLLLLILLFLHHKFLNTEIPQIIIFIKV